jgi:hypothetical protein
MPTLQPPPTQEAPAAPANDFCRPLYLRRVPEQVWILVHDNAIRSRMRLQDYIVEILKASEPFPR